jgi:hypothetical protein
MIAKEPVEGLIRQSSGTITATAAEMATIAAQNQT